MPPSPNIAKLAADQLATAEQRYAIWTWRYLRLTLIALLLGLGIAVGFERWKVHRGCFQDSISAYYYTPARSVLVGTLIAAGACLICVQCRSALENGVLNLAGILAPAVALVPTPNPGNCSSFDAGTALGRNENIANNGFTMLAVGLVAIFAAIGLTLLAIKSDERLPSPTTWIAHGIALVIWLLAVVFFIRFRSTFVGNAHYAAAIGLGVCIVAVVFVNAKDARRNQLDRPADPNLPTLKPWHAYAAVDALMVLVIVATVVMWIAGWNYWLLFIELGIAVLFAVFWAIQSVELWYDGLR